MPLVIAYCVFRRRPQNCTLDSASPFLHAVVVVSNDAGQRRLVGVLSQQMTWLLCRPEERRSPSQASTNEEQSSFSPGKSHAADT